MEEEEAGGGAGEAEVALDVSEVAMSSEAAGFSKLLLTSVPSLAGHLLRLGGRSMPWYCCWDSGNWGMDSFKLSMELLLCGETEEVVLE